MESSINFRFWSWERGFSSMKSWMDSWAHSLLKYVPVLWGGSFQMGDPRRKLFSIPTNGDTFIMPIQNHIGQTSVPGTLYESIVENEWKWPIDLPTVISIIIFHAMTRISGSAVLQEGRGLSFFGLSPLFLRENIFPCAGGRDKTNLESRISRLWWNV